MCGMLGLRAAPFQKWAIPFALAVGLDKAPMLTGSWLLSETIAPLSQVQCMSLG